MTNFSGVPHRTQFVGEVQQRRFYNDSKATNILATEMALSGFDNQKLLLLAGGLDRGNSFDELVPALLGLKAIVLFGETKEKLAEAAKKRTLKQFFAENVQTALPLPLIIRKKMILFYYHLLAQVGINTRILKYAGSLYASCSTIKKSEM